MNRFSTLRRATAGCVLSLTLGAGAARAEREAYSYLSYAGSEVSLISRAEEESSARANMPILAGDRLITGTSSRAEAVLADGTIVRVDLRSDLRFERLARTYESEDQRTILVLDRGTVAVEALWAPEQPMRFDTPDATVLVQDRAAFRVDAGRQGTEVYVMDGRVTLNARSGKAVLSAGEYAFVVGSEDIEIERVELPRDRFTRFVDERRELAGRHEEPAYVSADYQYDYGVSGLDDYGSWVYANSYGQYCWRPSVGADWSPYSQGYWRWTPSGMTWVSYEPWGWMPYHYGNWAWDMSFGWCWLPGAYYSPAWVYWSYSPGYVGWCPVGYYGYHHPYRSHHPAWGHETPWYPHLRGRVDLTQVSPRGWNYVNANRVAARLGDKDVLRGDRVRFNSGDVGVIATAPLRFDRGSGPVALTAQEAVRRAAQGDLVVGGARRTTSVDQGLTALLRRESEPSAAARETLQRTAVRLGHDPAYRSSGVDGGGGTRRGDADAGARASAGGGSGLPPTTRRSDGDASGPGSPFDRRGGTRSEVSERGGWREATPRVDASRGATVAVPRRDETNTRREGGTRADEGWRATGAVPRGTELKREDPQPSRGDDAGWRAPTSDVPRRVDPPRNDSPGRPSEERRSEPKSEPQHREAPPRVEPAQPAPKTDASQRQMSRWDSEGWRASEVPRRETRYEYRAYRSGNEAPRYSHTPRREVSNTYESSPSPSYVPRRELSGGYESRAPREYRSESPQYAPRSGSPQFRSAPSYDAPRSAPAPSRGGGSISSPSPSGRGSTAGSPSPSRGGGQGHGGGGGRRNN